MILYQLTLKRPTGMGHLGEIRYYTREDLAHAAGEASGVGYQVKPVIWA